MELEAYGSQTVSSSYLSLTTFSDNIKHSEMSHLKLGTLSLTNSLFNLSISLAGWPLISKCVQTSDQCLCQKIEKLTSTCEFDLSSSVHTKFMASLFQIISGSKIVIFSIHGNIYYPITSSGSGETLRGARKPCLNGRPNFLPRKSEFH